ncbi:glutathione S-transferase family protein [Halocynthiibacter sp. C4]|uniref:glutathione S-transferase family protein n=1 Tax=Halocynthiibacter sp. C4 TaxID=2992758 RepID=UPI00237B41E5|nr:glutathione S-transferase family protein [Halocynthiibacter sp. C4]MDE0591070.1 glutathione S-transferase family protein [Halocynthiibacter sp. C4]
MTYTVIGASRSRTIRVLWLLEELGVPYEHIPAAPHSKDITEVSPSGKIPALIVDGTVLTDSVAIMSFLADRHGGCTFPAGSIERAQLDGHLNFLNESMDFVLWSATKHHYAQPPSTLDPQVLKQAEEAFSNAQSEFEERLGEGPFLMGERFTIADILAAHCGGWAIGRKFPITSKRFRAYVSEMRARPAFQRVAPK